MYRWWWIGFPVWRWETILLCVEFVVVVFFVVNIKICCFSTKNNKNRWTSKSWYLRELFFKEVNRTNKGIGMYIDWAFIITNYGLSVYQAVWLLFHWMNSTPSGCIQQFYLLLDVLNKIYKQDEFLSCFIRINRQFIIFLAWFATSKNLHWVLRKFCWTSIFWGE